MRVQIQQALPPSRPRVHTQKNHDEYNGILHLPRKTHVRVTCHRKNINENNNTNVNDDDGASPTIRDSNRTEDHTYTYTYTYTCTITLHYKRNRACEIYRSLDDVLALSQNLLLAMGGTGCQGSGRVINNTHVDGHGKKTKMEKENENDNEEIIIRDTRRGNRRTRHAHASPCTCTCTCSCCTCPRAGRSSEAQVAEGADRILKLAVKRVRKGDADLAVKVALEWFLRRRLGDCDGRGGG